MRLTVLHNLLMPHMFGQMDCTGTLWKAELREDDSSAKLRRVDITNVPVDSMLIKMDDKATEPNTLFLEDAGQRMRCDYLLITKTNSGRKILLFIEIKSNTVDSEKVIQKFHASECLLDYIESMLGRFHHCHEIFNRYEKRFVLFQTRNLPKKATRPARRKSGREPENMRIFVSRHLEFTHETLEDLIR